MPQAEEGANTPDGENKQFVRKANSVRPQSTAHGTMGNKYETTINNAIEASLSRKATADVFGVGSPSGTGNQIPLMYVDPMFDPILLMFPKENLKELNRRLRHYRTFHPIVKNLIDLHSTFPFSDMEVRGEDKGLEPYWQDLSTRLSLMQMVVQMSGDYELLGECHRPGTKILLIDGKHKPVCRIQVGDEVVTATGLPGKVKYRTSKTVAEPLVGISIDGKRFSWMTKEHPVLRAASFYTLGDSHRQVHPIQKGKVLKFVRADELHVGDLVAIPKEIFLTSGNDPVGRVPGYEDIEISGELDGMQLFPIRKLKRRHYAGKVYSMEIDGDPTYIADGIVVHNSFHVGNWDEMAEEWQEFNQIPPENIEVHKTYVGPGVAYLLKADDELRKVLNSAKDIDQAVSALLPAEYRENLMAGKPTHLDNSRVIHYARKTSGYLSRGESPVKAALKYLLAEDKLYMYMLALIERVTFPIKIWKVGSKEQKWLPSKKHLDMLRLELNKIAGDPSADLIYHAYLDMEFKTGSDKHEDLIKWFDWTQRRILIALAANEAMFAEANPYAKEAMSIKLIMHRYMLQRTLINDLVSNKVWMPVAKKRGYVVHSRAEGISGVAGDKTYIPDIKKYSIPKMFWRPSNLVSGMQEQEFLLKLRDKGDMPAEVINDLLGYDQERIKTALVNEQGTPLDPRYRDALKELLKNPDVMRQILKGTKVKDIEIPKDLEGKVSNPKGAGRPSLPEDEKVKPPRALFPNNIVSPRDKMAEKGALPTPMGEELPPAV